MKKTTTLKSIPDWYIKGLICSLDRSIIVELWKPMHHVLHTAPMGPDHMLTAEWFVNGTNLQSTQDKHL